MSQQRVSAEKENTQRKNSSIEQKTHIPETTLTQQPITPAQFLRLQQVRGNRATINAIQRQEVPTAAPATLLVEDDSAELQAGQMRKSEFLAQLQAAVCNGADQALANSPYSAIGCPYIASIFPRLRNRPAAYIERGIQRFVPATRNASTATAYIAPVVARVQLGIANWLDTGQTPAVPPEFAGIASGAATNPNTDTINRQVDGSLQRMAEPLAIQRNMGRGQPLDGGTRQRIERGLGTSVGSVTIHTNQQATQLARQNNARAFTVGNHIAFDSGEYRPGTLIGDALLTHEMAHVVQQKGATTTDNSSQSKSLEEDADRTTIQAMIQLWGGSHEGLQEAFPHARTGLRLQRCSRDAEHDPEREMVTGAGLGSVITYEGKTLVQLGGEKFYISGKPPSGSFTPKGGSTSVVFIYRKSKPKKMYRLDYDTLKQGPKAGTKGWEHNQKGVAKILKLKVTNHQPAGGWGKVAGNSAKVFKYGGRAMFIVGLAAEGVNIYYAENKARAIAKAGGSLAGGAGGAWAGAKGGGAVGAWFGPWGAAIGAGIGGLAGGALGAWGGGEATEAVYDLIVEPLEEEEWIMLTEDEVEPAPATSGAE